MFKHTPGRWFVEFETIVQSEEVIKGRSWVANTCQPDTVDGLESEMDKANAHLISAAPELLEVCKILKESYMQEAPTITMGYFQKLIDAIEKAEGRRPCEP